jgi:hypothetical protein
MSAEQVEHPTVPRGWRYADHIPYSTPDSLDDLRGPTSGTVRVQGHIDTSPDPVYDLGDPGQVWSLCTRVVRDGTAQDQVEFLDLETLLGLWSTLNLPTRCRMIWEAKFSVLAAPSGRRSA